MFARTIVLSDAFTDMPLSARCLYFTLGMQADDDGFVSAPKSIMRAVNATEDDLKLLLVKRFILAFDTGVIVIKHWRINNYLRNDRYTKTKFLKELAQLTTDKNGAYTEAENSSETADKPSEDTLGIPSNGIPSNGIPSIGKVSIDNICASQATNIDETLPPATQEAKGCASAEAPPVLADRRVEYKKIVSLFNAICQSLPQVKTINATRQNNMAKTQADLETGNLTWEQFFQLVEDSDFLCGRDKAAWQGCSFDWIILPRNRVKIIEGNYSNRRKALQEGDKKLW